LPRVTGLTYRDAGVDIDAGDELVGLLVVEPTRASALLAVFAEQGERASVVGRVLGVPGGDDRVHYV
jgi:phosphoribosylaminoimidazole (AIR) synthetase